MDLMAPDGAVAGADGAVPESVGPDRLLPGAVARSGGAQMARRMERSEADRRRDPRAAASYAEYIIPLLLLSFALVRMSLS